jgi:hypothetical protein
MKVVWDVTLELHEDGSWLSAGSGITVLASTADSAMVKAKAFEEKRSNRTARVVGVERVATVDVE